MAKIILGKIGQAYGVRGWLKVHSFTRPTDNILNYFPWQLQHQNLWREVLVTHSKKQGNNILVKLSECNSPEKAKTFTHNLIGIEREQLPELPRNEYYWADLIGLQVINQEGVDFGFVDSLLETGSHDVLVVKGDRRRLLPYTDEVIIKIDLAHKVILVHWDIDF